VFPFRAFCARAALPELRKTMRQRIGINCEIGRFIERESCLRFMIEEIWLSGSLPGRAGPSVMAARPFQHIFSPTLQTPSPGRHYVNHGCSPIVHSDSVPCSLSIKKQVDGAQSAVRRPGLLDL